MGINAFSAGGYLTSFVGTRYNNGVTEPDSRNAQIMSMLLGEPDLNDPIDQNCRQILY